MRLNTARYHLRALGRPATYTALDGSQRALRAKIEDADAEVRMGGSMEVVTHDATAFVPADLDPERGATLTQLGNEYRIDGIREAKSPGMLELDLARIAGDGVNRWDFSRGIGLLGAEEIVYEGQSIRAHINRHGVHFEDQGYGVPVETVRVIALIRESDAPAIAGGDFVAIDGQEKVVVKVLRTGQNTLKVVL